MEGYYHREGKSRRHAEEDNGRGTERERKRACFEAGASGGYSSWGGFQPNPVSQSQGGNMHYPPPLPAGMPAVTASSALPYPFGFNQQPMMAYPNWQALSQLYQASSSAQQQMNPQPPRDFDMRPSATAPSNPPLPPSPPPPSFPSTVPADNGQQYASSKLDSAKPGNPPLPPTPATPSQGSSNASTPTKKTDNEAEAKATLKSLAASKVMIGKRRGKGKTLPTGMIARATPAPGGKSDVDKAKNKPPWSKYLEEVQQYKSRVCIEDNPNRPLVK